MTSPLLNPLEKGRLKLANRVFMAPLTRQRASQPGDIPSELNATYYAQRATAGLIVSEATQVSRQGQGYAWTPGIYTDAQAAGWRKVTDAVHAQGGQIALQLWHVGRISHDLLQENDQPPVAPSALAAKAKTFVVQKNGVPAQVDCSLPRALQAEELPGIVNDFRKAARRAADVGFDLVEVHAANGYLLNQFLATGPNQRLDAYGGTLENRARFPLQVIEAVVAELGADRVGVRISPFGTFNDIQDDEAELMAYYLMEQFERLGLAYVHVAEPDWAGGPQLGEAFRKGLRVRYSGVLVFAGGYTQAKAEALINDGTADAVAFGRLFIANPDLVARFAQGADLNQPDPATFYGGAEKGYTDYPFLPA